MVDGLTREFLPLLNPLQSLDGGYGARHLLDYSHKEFLQDLRGSAEVDRFNKLHSALSLGLVFARSDRRINEDVGIEERPNGHANPPWSRSSCRAGLETVRSIAAIAPGRALPDPHAWRDEPSAP